MVDRFEEGLGKYPYITLEQVKSYLSISSTTHDATLSNILLYATGVVEHYIGQQVLANDYVEIFDGGTTSVFVNRLPLSNVYSVQEFDGVDNQILADPSTIGSPNLQTTDELSIIFKNNAHISSRIKKFGKSSLKLDTNDYVYANSVPDQLKFEDGDFTIEMFVRVDEPTLQNTELFSINTDSDNYMKLSLANSYGLSFESNIDGASNTVLGANTSIEEQQYAKRRWAHVAVCRELEEETVKLFYNGNVIANSSYEVSNHSFTANIEIGSTFKGFIDELRISDTARYDDNFTAPIHRFRPDEHTLTLIHFDGKNNSTEAKDVHAVINEYSYSRDSGEITRDTGDLGVTGNFPNGRRSYPKLTLGGPAKFQPYPSGIKVEYRAGYEQNDVPYDLQLATLDMVKILHKQDQDKKGFSFEGERGDKYNLSGSFPPHIRRILDFYRIIS